MARRKNSPISKISEEDAQALRNVGIKTGFNMQRFNISKDLKDSIPTPMDLDNFKKDDPTNEGLY